MTRADILAAVLLHRSMYREELSLVTRTTASHVPAETEPITEATYDGSEWRPGPVQVEVTDSGPLGGEPLSAQMNRHLGPPSGFGSQRPWSHAFHYLRRACRNDHPGHTARPTFGGSLCWQAVAYSVLHDYTVPTIASLLSIPDDEFYVSEADVERHLLRAFAWIEEDMDRKQRIRNGYDPRPSEEPTPTRLSLLQCDAAQRQVADFDLEQRIWESQRNLHPELELSAWDVEWARRMETLREHQATCDRCRRAAA